MCLNLGEGGRMKLPTELKNMVQLAFTGVMLKDQDGDTAGN